MFDRPQVMQVASALASHAARRQMAIAENVANADTPGYRARDLTAFAESYRSSADDAPRQTRPGHLGAVAGAGGADLVERTGAGHLSPNGNSVSLEREMVASAAVRRDHDMALTVYRKSLDILRSSLGRR
jgi:flagellar basal-body rod protein FlgB